MAVPLLVCIKEEQRSVVLFYGQLVCRVLKSTHFYVLNMETMLVLGEGYTGE
jgi:hypothetical protein